MLRHDEVTTPAPETARSPLMTGSRAVLIASVLAVVAVSGQQRQERIAQAPPRQPGQTVTLLSDGRWLFLGGEGAERRASLWDPETASLVEFETTQARAWHTATVVPDGTVFVFGGVDADGEAIAAPQRFVPAMQAFQSLPDAGLTPRAHHAATLLTDGRVLLTGGTAAATLDDAVYWDATLQAAEPVPAFLNGPRRDHSSVLDSNGRVILNGGVDGNGRRVERSEVFDPGVQLFVDPRIVFNDAAAAGVAESIPQNGAIGLSTTTRVAVRFSRPIDVRSVNNETVSLAGPDGTVSAQVVVAEGGRLLFVTPTSPLRAESSYEMTLRGLSDARSRARLEETTIWFATGPDGGGSPDLAVDDEAWLPTDPSRWRTDRSESSWESQPRLEAAPGVTAVSGQVLRLNSRPLANVTLSIGGQSTRTDRTGRFLLTDLPSGRQILEIKGATAGTPGRTYGFFEVSVQVSAGQTNILPYTIWMPMLDTTHTVTLPSPTTSEVVVTTPFIKGLELHIPPNTVIRGEDGEVVREISITPIPVDRPPFPLPKNLSVPVYFTIQPGSAYVYTRGGGVRGARLVYPNYHNAQPGELAVFWHYDPEEIDWHTYGAGRVMPDGKQVVPDPGVAFYEFTGAMMITDPSPPAVGPVPNTPKKGDPVDVGTGLFVLEKRDLVLPDVIPLALTRTYRQNDPARRAFGIGSTHPYDMYLWSANMYQETDLVLPDGGRIHYVRISPGTDIQTAVFEHTATPGPFYKSRITWRGLSAGWDLTLQDGTVYVMGDIAPLQAIRDRYGNTVTITRSGGQIGNITKITSPNGRWITFSYDGSNRITQATDNIGRTVGYTYDASGRLWKVTDPANGVTEYTYDTSHRMLTLKDARGITYLTNHYDANGRVDLQTQADSTTYQFAYTLDGTGKVTQTDTTNPRGFVTRYSFNGSGHHTSLVEAVGTVLERTTTWTRASGTNHITEIVDPLGRHTTYAYDANGNVESVTRLAGTGDAVTTSHTYEPKFKLLATLTDPLSHTTTFTRDSNGNVTTITDPLSHQTAFTYNGSGQPLTVTTATGTTQLTYLGGDLVGTTDALGRTTTRFVDAAGRLLSTISPLGQMTRHEYDVLNAVTKTIDPLGGETTFTYDANRNLLTLTDALNHTTTYTYNSMDRVDTRTDPLSRGESFVYDANGNPSQHTDRKSQVTATTYDALDRVATVSYQDGSTTTYTYDAGDRLTQVADSIAGTITRTWDLLDRLTNETTPEGSISYTYDTADRRATMTVAGQPPVTYGYDDASRLTSITQGSSVVGFTYDDADRRTQLALPNGVTVDYGYDAASQISSLTYKLGATTLGDLAYTYDLKGNRTSVGGSWARTGLPTALASATYDSANQIATWAGTTFTYDANGSLTNDGAQTYSWNARNQLTGLSGSLSASFQYDALGRRRGKTISGTSTGFLYDGLNIVQELSGGSPSANILAGLGIDERFTRTDGTGAQYFLGDVLGSTVALATGSGTVQTDYTYQPFGQTTSSGASTANPFGFTGRENDATGLYYYRARYHSPLTARFASEDPLEYFGQFGNSSSNLYAYVKDSPVMLVDPTGQQAEVIVIPDILAKLGAAVGGLSAGTVGVGLGVTGAVMCAASPTCRLWSKCLWEWARDFLKCKGCDDLADEFACRDRAADNFQKCLARLPRLYPDPRSPDTIPGVIPFPKR
jgi:RHS repeat-associated protein